MQHSRFSEQQIAFVLDQVARGASIEGTCHAAGIPVQTFYHWRAQYAGLPPSEIRRLQELQEATERENHHRIVTAPAAAPASTSRALVPYREAVPVAAAPMPANPHWQQQSGYPTEQNRRVVQAVAKPVQHRSVPQLADRRLVSTRPPETTRPARLGQRWRGRIVLIVCFAAGLVGGFAMGLAPDTADTPSAGAPVNMHMRADNALAGTMDKGWGQSQPWGRWMERGTASVLFGFDAPARGDVELLIEARTRLAPDQPAQTLIVRFNGAELSRWRLPATEGQARRRFIVPRDVFNRDTAAQLTFELDGRAPLSAVFGLEAVSLRDAKFLHAYRGFVDSCSNGKVGGWAIAEGIGVSVLPSVDGKPLAVSQSNIERADLASQNIPTDAGFELTLAEPPAPGSAVDVRFADGRPLLGSPCRP
jgi:putative transposase